MKLILTKKERAALNVINFDSNDFCPFALALQSDLEACTRLGCPIRHFPAEIDCHVVAELITKLQNGVK